MADDSIQLVIFDLGRVLIRIVDAWWEAYEAAGVPVDRENRDQDLFDQVSSLFARHEIGKIETDAFLRVLAGVHRIELTQADAIMHAWLRGPYPGIHALMDELDQTGVKLACLSNTNDHHWQEMVAEDGPNALKLSRLDYRFASHIIGAAKPDPAIYEHVEQETSVSPAQIAFFDDHPPNIEAAKARGWQARLIEHDGDPVTQMRTHLIDLGVLPA